jgi:hypothetical protein
MPALDSEYVGKTLSEMARGRDPLHRLTGVRPLRAQRHLPVHAGVRRQELHPMGSEGSRQGPIL